MKVKRTQEIFLDQFKLSHPATSGEFTKHLVKKWVAVDDIINWLELEVHRAGAPYQMVEELKKSLSKSELPIDSKESKGQNNDSTL